MEHTNPDFKGWATRANVRCSDGRTILPDAFKHNDGKRVPLVWNHQHNDPMNVLGYAILKNRPEGVYAYGYLNDTPIGEHVRECLAHGDIAALSIAANQLKQDSSRRVMHGEINELSIVLAGANPKAYIETVMKHGLECEDEAIIYFTTDEGVTLVHGDEADELEEPDNSNLINEEDTMIDTENQNGLKHADESEGNDGKTIKDVYESMNEEQKAACQYLVAMAIADNTDENNNTSEEDEGMKHNAFEKEEVNTTLSHADEMEILAMAKDSSVGSLKKAIEIYQEEHTDELAHGIEGIDMLFPDYKDVYTGAPHVLEQDQSWVKTVMAKASKSPISRVRTRFADARASDLRAKGYNDRKKAKTLSGDLKLIMRTTDPQTVYRRDELHRDDIIDITDFDVVAFQRRIMRSNLEEEIALAALIGDRRDDTDPDKIHEDHIRPIWTDDELYTIRATVDVEAAKKELQGTNTSANFGENYIMAEAIITAFLYAREKYKGKGNLDFLCTAHLLNVMLLARDLNGRRIYDSKADLAKALNVNEIYEIEQFDGVSRTDSTGAEHKLLALAVNMGNYQFGSSKGGEITNFDDFDIDFNKYKYLMETRVSGALVDPYSAIALEEVKTSD